MQAYSCMLCKKSDPVFINIFTENGRKSVKDDILEICGNSVAEYLKSDDIVCSKCMKFLEWFLDSAGKLRRKVCDIVFDYGANRQVSGQPGTKVLDLLELVKYFDYVELAEEITNNLPRASPRNFQGSSTSPHSFMGTSPDNLLMVKSSIPFDERSDTDMEEANSKYRYYERDTPILDREVQRVNHRRRRTRGHNWTRRKGSQRSRSHSLARSSSHHSRYSRTTAHSRSSRGTTASKKSQIQEQSQIMQKKRILSDFLYQNDSLAQFARAYLNKNGEIVDDDFEFDFEWNIDTGKPVIKTRYASEVRDRMLAEYEQLIYECPVSSCRKIFFTLEQVTEHRVKEHNEMALFWCEQCKFSYVSQEDLEKHKDHHFRTFLSYCIYCSEEFTNKKLYEEHLNEHLIHSFPCIYCDKFFLRKQLCDNHIREQHPGRKKKIKRIKPQSILDRIDKYPDQRDELERCKSTSSPQEFVVKVLRQHGQPEDASASNKEDLNVEDLNNEHFKDICDTRENNADIISTNN